MRVFTHFNVNLDAAASVWALRTFVPGTQTAKVVFVPANWNGEMEDGDLAVDIDAGGRGMKGEHRDGGIVGSGLALIVDRYAPEGDQAALSHLIAFVDAQDAHGSAYKWLAPETNHEAQAVFSATGLNAVLRAFQARHPRNGELIVRRMSEIFDGILTAGRARQRGVIEADRAELIGDGRVAITYNSDELSTPAVLHERGVEVIVYVKDDDNAGHHNLGLARERSGTLRMDHVILRDLVEDSGEQIGGGGGEWFAHPSGFLLARGTRKAPCTYPKSKVNPRRLAEAVYELLDTVE
jgi:hypothetical protein